MKILVLGATGATGRLLTEQLLERGHTVRVIVRSADRLPEKVKQADKLEVIQAAVLDLTDEELARHAADCDAVASCLGHNLSFKGIYGKPRKLVADAVRRTCEAVRANEPEKPVKFVLMNTVAVLDRDQNETHSFKEKLVFTLIRLLLPPHRDNEAALAYLKTEIGSENPVIEWSAVRPDGLIDKDEVSEYEVYPTLQQSAVFGDKKTSRINTAHFMAELISNPDTWAKWKGRMPVVYNTFLDKASDA